jgi:hypothetical protein
MNNGMFRHGNDSVGMMPTVQDTTGGKAEKQMSVVVGRVRTQSQGTHGVGYHCVVSFLGDMHVFTKRKLTMLVLNQCPSNERAGPRTSWTPSLGGNTLSRKQHFGPD